MINTRNEAYIIAFGSHLRKLRKEKKISMEKLADLADVEYSQIAKIETGKINTTISTAYVLATALKDTVAELFQFELPSKKKK